MSLASTPGCSVVVKDDAGHFASVNVSASGQTYIASGGGKYYFSGPAVSVSPDGSIIGAQGMWDDWLVNPPAVKPFVPGVHAVVTIMPDKSVGFVIVDGPLVLASAAP